MPDTAGGGLAYPKRVFLPFHHFAGFKTDHHHIVGGHAL
jgi:hypothetical protein